MLDKELMAEPPALVVKDVSGQYIALLLYAATFTVQVYDTLLTLDKEFTYIWRSKWTPIKGVFLIVRYLSLSIYLFQVIALKLPSDLLCSVAKWVIALGGMFVGAAAGIFLICRVYAIYGKNKHILVLLVVFLIGWEIALFSLGITLLPHYINAPDPIPQLYTLLGEDCASVNYPQKIAILWIGMLSYQSILCTCLLLTMIRDQYRSWKLGLRCSPLYMVFVRDGLWAYFLIVVLLVFCVISIFKAQYLGDSSFMLFITTTTICCCHLILNLRSAAYKPAFDGSSQSRFSTALKRQPLLEVFSYPVRSQTAAADIQDASLTEVAVLLNH